MKEIFFMLMAIMAIALGQSAEVSTSDMKAIRERTLNAPVATQAGANHEKSAIYSITVIRHLSTTSTLITETGVRTEPLEQTIPFTMDSGSTWTSISTTGTSTYTATSTWWSPVVTAWNETDIQPVMVQGPTATTGSSAVVTSSTVITATSEPNLTSAEASTRQRHKVIAWSSAGGFLGLFILIGGGWLFWKNKQHKEQQRRNRLPFPSIGGGFPGDGSSRPMSPIPMLPRARTTTPSIVISSPLSNPALVTSDSHRAEPLRNAHLVQQTANGPPVQLGDMAPLRPARPASLTESIQESMDTIPIGVAMDLIKSANTSPVMQPRGDEHRSFIPVAIVKKKASGKVSMTTTNSTEPQIGDPDQRFHEDIAEQVGEALDQSSDGVGQADPAASLASHSQNPPRTNPNTFDDDESDDDVREQRRVSTLRQLDPTGFQPSSQPRRVPPVSRVARPQRGLGRARSGTAPGARRALATASAPRRGLSSLGERDTTVADLKALANRDQDKL
ncbi:uncharacterized protein L3040_004495 [Drepanopeziza brunnea f. sp. 'multigermtubi']|uniref:Uncharacterized protein n=1 Tax=Marssonina brunnea f. sp. multigermtubi (strain MB_m1) TaxID=1072389 RepID=K1WJT0_MARBU|nr:uncharacterized protein MBM_03727 [Drepanopeziza brunnea f. sp. 'multigermtubi' MB_m1]EKD17955.1 hypothetical protein MBM_03727 [Drepanopeziza brunnea f. sp. 'multigermtubi' MB_m1]KAJ5043110.1 hypothetical protein L3040_004495 [Drepanopeziza brunnea f. sp. 'multigermtubi']